jgi:hypothetical protein
MDAFKGLKVSEKRQYVIRVVRLLQCRGLGGKSR